MKSSIKKMMIIALINTTIAMNLNGALTEREQEEQLQASLIPLNLKDIDQLNKLLRGRDRKFIRRALDWFFYASIDDAPLDSIFKAIDIFIAHGVTKEELQKSINEKINVLNETIHINQENLSGAMLEKIFIPKHNSIKKYIDDKKVESER